MRTVHPAKLSILLAAVMLIGLATAGSTAMAQGTDAQRQACGDDAMRLCSEFVPDVNKISACMGRKKSQLSPACRQEMFGGGSRRRHHHCKNCD